MKDVVFWSVWGAMGIFMLVYYLRRQHPIRSCLVGAGSGLFAMILVHYGGGLFGYTPPLNPLNLIQSVIFGIPGVILMIALHITL